MKRYAICFFGIVGTTIGKSLNKKGDSLKCLELSSDLYKNRIINKNDNVDIFLHSSSKELEKEILEKYKPVSYIIEKQKKFKTPSYSIGTEARKQSHYSRWWSQLCSVDLKKKYEKENGFKYDGVFVTRYDLAWQRDIVFKEMDEEKFWTAGWNVKYLKGKRSYPGVYYRKLKHGKNKPEDFKTIPWGYPVNNHGFYGTWYYSSSENIDKFSDLYHHLDEYEKPGNCPKTHPGDSISHHRLMPYHAKNKGLLSKVEFLGDFYLDFPLVRQFYFYDHNDY